ncbi:hypothetical protein WMY93_023533 [Mugilogobius chulae]|uniref:Mucosa-associated lymphoid tissue lymphoma translocation protein 1 n=1 Tax=Mugilogobius chulae TaxID=88201 RepID=A0AAW0NFM5_9GOBI
MIGEIDIVCHPVDACVPARHKLVLSVLAKGPGTLHYQWYNYVQNDGRRDVCEVPGATQPNLVITVTKSQNYSCRVNDSYCNCKCSKWAQVSVLDTENSGLPPQWQGEPHVAVNPKPQTLRPGAKLTLRCTAFGVPQPKYQWYRNGHPLSKQTKEVLQVTQAGVRDAGTYLCAVTNVWVRAGASLLMWTYLREQHCHGNQQALLHFIQGIILQENKCEETPAPFTATDKVALLIGNLNYSHHPRLTAPVMDVHELGLLLQQLGFRGVYGLFYYAGHGFERAGRNYLVPVDAPQPYHPSTCVCVQRIMGEMQEKRTALSVILLDACRKWCKEEGTPSIIQPLKPTGNTVYGYATCEDAEAFEVQHQGKSTGIFTKYLNKHILLPEKVTHVLEKVSEDVDKDILVKGKQAVEIRHSLKEARSLTDRVHSAGHTRELNLRDICWRQANELPQKKCLKFPCGAEVEVGFSALFSNVLVAFANVKRSDPHIMDCTVGLSSTPAMNNIFSGDDISDEFDSLLNQPDNPDRTIFLCGLQTLKESLIVRVDLHYTVQENESMRRVTQTQQLNVGKPLVASCGLTNKAASPKHSAQAHNTNISQQRSQGPSTVQPSSRKATVCTK